jgi:hypothetical protein
LDLMGRLGCAEFISRGDPGLHILSFFLTDYILRAGGYMILVMPASTFCTGQDSGLKRHLRVRYYVLGTVGNGLYPSFSVGGGFKELVLFLKEEGCRRGGWA